MQINGILGVVLMRCSLYLNIMDSPNLEFYLPKPKILFLKTHNIFLLKAEHYFVSLGQNCYAHKNTRENIYLTKLI